MEAEGLYLLDEALPALDAEEMEDLYQHFLVDEMPEEDDGDEDFEPAPVDEEEEGEEAGVRRRNIQARELNDLLHDAYKQHGPSFISPGLRERVLDQLSMHFQLLIQTGVLAAKESSAYREEERSSLGMLEHLIGGSDKAGNQARRTRAKGKCTIWWDSVCEGSSSLGIPGLLPAGTLQGEIKEVGRLSHPGGISRRAIERLMTSRGAVVWPQLLPSKVFGGVNWHSNDPRGHSPAFGRQDVQIRCAEKETVSPTLGGASGCESRGPSGGSEALRATSPSSFSLVEDRLLCRGIHLHRVDWGVIKDKFLPHRPIEALTHRYAILSGWASIHGTPPTECMPQACPVPWTHQEDLNLTSAVQKYGKKWAIIARDVLPNRGRASLRSRWGLLEERLAGGVPGRALLCRCSSDDGGGAGTATAFVSKATDETECAAMEIADVEARAAANKSTAGQDASSLRASVGRLEVRKISQSPDGMENDFDGSPTRSGIDARTEEPGASDRIAYAEDELSDDSVGRRNVPMKCQPRHKPNVDQDSQRVSSYCQSDHPRRRRGSPPITPVERLYEEDELSDNGDKSV